MRSSFRALDAARGVVDEINQLLDRCSLFYANQLRESSGSITANIREGLGKRAGPERALLYRIARGSVEETDERLRANWRRQRIPDATFWRLHNRLVAISRMLGAMVEGAAPTRRSGS